MHKYNAHGATDVTGFGLLGHANNLAKIQTNEVGFVIHNLPVIAKMAAITKACQSQFRLMQGYSPETSGDCLLKYPFQNGLFENRRSVINNTPPLCEACILHPKI